MLWRNFCCDRSSNNDRTSTTTQPFTPFDSKRQNKTIPMVAKEDQARLYAAQDNAREKSGVSSVVTPQLMPI